MARFMIVTDCNRSMGQGKPAEWRLGARVRPGFSLMLPTPAPNLLATNHMGVMESGENPEQSRCGIRIQIPTKSIVRKGGEDGDEA
jgi:hypothetical protein